MTSCRTCGETWTGLKPEHCPVPGCHETFAGTTAGDAHRVGDHNVAEGPDRRRCLSPEEMVAAGLTRNDRGHWSIARDLERARERGARMASNPSGVSPGTAQVALPGVPGTPHPETPGNP